MSPQQRNNRVSSMYYGASDICWAEIIISASQEFVAPETRLALFIEVRCAVNCLRQLWKPL
jgi:hypothetical protein